MGSRAGEGCALLGPGRRDRGTSGLDSGGSTAFDCCPSLVAEVVYAVPNDASKPLVNAVGGAIVLVDRGGVPILDKILRVQDVRVSIDALERAREGGGEHAFCSLFSSECG